MDYAVSRARLKNYFSTVTYIDDRFDHCIVDEPIDFGDEEILDAPPLPTFDIHRPLVTTGESETVSFTDEKDIEVNLSTILTALNGEKYAGVRFTPVLFKDDLAKDILVKKIQESPLTLIDWNLGANEKAFDFINMLFDTTKQLKVIVVYTSNYVEAIGAMNEDEHLKDCQEITTTYSNFSCYRCNHQSLLVVAAKQSYNLETILDIIPEIFINNCGLMPVALLDYMASVQHISDELFGAFCHPFEDVYWLQMYFSELNDADIPNTMASFIQNKFSEHCSVDYQITEELFTYHKNRLNLVIEQDDESAKASVNMCWQALKPHLSGINIEFCDAICAIEYPEFKVCCEQAIEKAATWRDFLKAFDPILCAARKKVAEARCDNLFSPYSVISIPDEAKPGIDEHLKSIRERFTKEIASSYQDFKTQIFPIFIQSLISSPDLLFAGVELVKNLKYKIYSSTDLSELLYAGKELGKGKKAAFLMNKIHFGDVLVRSDGEEREYLLCITPPCDVFRPEKTKLNINFIRGQELKREDLNTRKKENIHVSILPVKEGDANEKLIYIAWQFFGVVNFDMNQEADYEKLCSFSRPVMMSEQYTRQIANAFTAYFSRAGVDEVFMKAAGNLQTIFG